MEQDAMKEKAFAKTAEQCLKAFIAFVIMIAMMYTCSIMTRMMESLHTLKAPIISADILQWTTGVFIVLGVVMSVPYAKKIYREELQKLSAETTS